MAELYIKGGGTLGDFFILLEDGSRLLQESVVKGPFYVQAIQVHVPTPEAIEVTSPAPEATQVSVPVPEAIQVT